MKRYKCRINSVAVLGPIICSLLVAGAGQASAQQTKESADKWSFRVSPYVWAASMEGTVSTLPRLPTAEVDASFGDIFDNLDFGLMASGEARKDKFGIIVDAVYMKISAKGPTPFGRLYSSVKVENEVFMSSLNGAYRVHDESGVTVDLIGGARLYSVENALTLRAGLLAERQFDDSDTWVDPLVGLRINADISDGFYVRGYTDLGGVVAGSDTSWQIFGSIGYRVSDWLSAEFGYRHLKVDYDNDTFVYDVDFSGPIIGANFRF